MSLALLPRYLTGDRRAILDLAASRTTFLIGAIFVLSAGLAREYDGEDLLHEPWHALRPLGASIASGTLLFLVVHGAALANRSASTGARPPFYVAWRTFLGLFWMTAPMAWLYAIPYERFLEPLDAIVLNLWTLAVVAAWRVALMSRVVQVLYGVGFGPALVAVLLFADAVTLVVITQVPTPVIDVMGGVRPTDRELLIRNVTFFVTLASSIAGPVLLLVSFGGLHYFRPAWPVLASRSNALRLRGLLLLSVLSIFAVVPLLLVAQPEQIHRRSFETLFEVGRISEAIEFMSTRTRRDFPPHWNPVPKVGTRDSGVELDAVVEILETGAPTAWVVDLFLSALERDLRLAIAPWMEPNATWVSVIQRGLSAKVDQSLESRHRATARLLLVHDSTLSNADRRALELVAR